MKIYLWADNNSYWPLDWLQFLPVQQIWRSCTRRSRLFSFPQTWSSDVAIAGSCYPHSSRWPQGRSGHLSSISLRVAGLRSHSDTFSANRSDSNVRVCLKHNTLSRCFRWFCHRQITLIIAWNQSVQPLKSQEWSNSNFSIQYRYIIRQTDEETNEKGRKPVYLFEIRTRSYQIAYKRGILSRSIFLYLLSHQNSNHKKL